MKIIHYVALFVFLVVPFLGYSAVPPIVKELNPAQKEFTFQYEQGLQEIINAEITNYIQSRDDWCFDTDRDVCTNQPQVDDIGDIIQSHGYTKDDYGVAAQLFINTDGLVLSIQAVMLSRVIEGEKFVHIWNLQLVNDDREPGPNDI